MQKKKIKDENTAQKNWSFTLTHTHTLIQHKRKTNQQILPNAHGCAIKTEE